MQSIPGLTAVCPDPGAANRYTAVPDRLLSVLTPREHQLVHALLSFRWFEDSPIVPRVKTLADRIGCHPRTVQRAAAKLQARGLIEIVPRYRDDEGQCSNEYRPTAGLLAMLPRAAGSDAAESEPRRQTPTTAAAYRRTDRNTQKRTGRPEPRYNQPVAAGHCFGCGGPHMTMDCQRRLGSALRR